MRAPGLPLLLGLALGLGASARAGESLVLHEASRPDRPDSPNALLATTAHSTAWLSLEAHCLRRLSLPWPERRILVGADLDLPVFLWGDSGRIDALRVGVRGAAEVFRTHGFSLVVDLQSRLGAQESVLNSSVGWDLQLTVGPSFSFARWSLTPFLGVRKNLATYVRQGQIVTDGFADRYPDGGDPGGPRNGWLAGGATRVPFGLAFGVDLARQLSLQGAAGLIESYSPMGVGMFDGMMLGHWPFFVELGVGWRL